MYQWRMKTDKYLNFEMISMVEDGNSHGEMGGPIPSMSQWERMGWLPETARYEPNSRL
jgi:hypothetical protein